MITIIYIICFIIFLLTFTVFGAIYMLSTEMPNLRTIYKTFIRDVRAVYLYYRMVSFVKKCHSKNLTVPEFFRNNVKKYKDRVCFVFEDEEWTYQQVDDFSNKIANFFLSQGFSKGDEVALIMDNCPEYACIWLGLAKIGVVTALINTNLKGDTLGHSINVVDVRAAIFGRNYSDVIKDGIPFMNNKEKMEFFCYSRDNDPKEIVFSKAKSLNAFLEEASVKPINPEKVKINVQDKMLYIYTSGTTGLPKAAIIRHGRFLWICAATQFFGQLHNFETIYNPLPMYHTAGGILFVSVVIIFGGKMILRKKFSASNYWKEAMKHKATVGQYIGEICRYLLNQPNRPEETQHSIRLMFGNGLRPHIWKEFQDRFKISHVLEIYGATEGNANLLNMFGKVGAVGFLPKVCDRLSHACLVRVDQETGEPLRDSKGLCVRCKAGEPGEIIGKITTTPVNAFDGYANQKDTNKKIIQDCFEKGDRGFLSGDVLVMDDEGYLYFVDRTGDTFRWKGENVSTGEVENVISTGLGHVSCVVYGVEIPNAEGRAGMATIQIDSSSINLTDLYQNVCKRLPGYAIPLFLRVSSEIEATGTYKLRKVTLQKEGYDPKVTSDPMYFLDIQRKAYVPLTLDLYSDIVGGKVRL